MAHFYDPNHSSSLKWGKQLRFEFYVLIYHGCWKKCEKRWTVGLIHCILAFKTCPSTTIFSQLFNSRGLQNHDSGCPSLSNCICWFIMNFEIFGKKFKSKKPPFWTSVGSIFMIRNCSSFLNWKKIARVKFYVLIHQEF